MAEAFTDAFSGYNIIGLLIAGLVLGIIGRFLAPGEQKIPWWLTILAGIGGALIGNVLAALLKVEDTAGIDWIRHALQVGGAVVTVLLAAGLWAKVKGGSRAAA